MDIDVDNIGGIEDTQVQIDPGTTILSGRNATNRTSLLQAIMAAMGSDQATLKADADEGAVSLSIGDETFERQLRRENGAVLLDGEPYLDEPELADLFAFLLEDNEARQAVEQNRDLREVIMRPVDTDAIHAEIEELSAEKQRLDDKIAELEEEKDRLPELEAERSRLDEKLQKKKAELESKEEEIDETDGAIEETRETKDELDEKLEELRETRSELDDVRYDLETERDGLESLREERDDIEEELESHSDTPAGERTEIETRLDALRERKQSISSDVSQLQTIIQFNEDMLDGGDTDLLDAVSAGETAGTDDASSPTDKLVDDSEELVCWTCGNEVERAHVESIVDDMRELRQQKLSERNDVDDEIGELKSEKQELERQQQRREELSRKLDRRTDEIERTEETIEELEARSEELVDAVASLETTIEELEEQEYSELLELHKEANQLEFEIDRLASEYESTEKEIESIEERLDQRSDIEEERSEIVSQLEDLRTQIDRTERQAVESFNDHMDEVLNALEYENIERVWIERQEREVREGRRKVSKSTFELHVVRESASGAAYEDTIDHLSESERDVIGLVFALAGYLTHEVYDEMPLMLLDSLEALDSERIEALVEYLQGYVDSLVIALLEEDAEAFDESDNHVSIEAFSN
nr:archaea-specific SMC-related protein [Salinarchaeum laminariae]